MAAIKGSTGPARNTGIWRRSAGSKAVAVLLIGARGGLRHHSATAKQYCPSSSAVVRHSTPEHAMKVAQFQLREAALR
jgi:hypothetical protein